MNTNTAKNIATQPFMFDVNFAAPEPVVPDVQDLEPEIPEEEIIPTIEVPAHEALLATAREKAFQEGLEAGKKSEEARLADEAVKIAASAEKIFAAIDADRKTLEAESAALALSIAKRLAAETIKKFPLEDIEKLISDCLGPLRKTPHLVVRLNEKNADSINETVGQLARERGFEGRFVVLGEPDFQEGDCKIEWADGGIVRDRKKTEQDIFDTFKAFFATETFEPLDIPEVEDGTADTQFDSVEVEENIKIEDGNTDDE